MVERALRESEEATNKKKNGRGKGKRKRTKAQVVSSDDDIDNSTDDISDVEEPLDSEVLDYIEVA